MIDKAQDTISRTIITVGAPLTGGGIGIIGICEKMAPVLTVISILIGIVLGIISFYLKRKLIKKEIEKLNNK